MVFDKVENVSFQSLFDQVFVTGCIYDRQEFLGGDVGVHVGDAKGG